MKQARHKKFYVQLLAMTLPLTSVFFPTSFPILPCKKCGQLGRNFIECPTYCSGVDEIDLKVYLLSQWCRFSCTLSILCSSYIKIVRLMDKESRRCSCLDIINFSSPQIRQRLLVVLPQTVKYLKSHYYIPVNSETLP